MEVPFPSRGSIYTLEDSESLHKVLTEKFGHRAKWAALEEFEGAFAKYTGSKHAVSSSNCTSALHLALIAAGIKAGDEVITTPFTWVATSNAIFAVGARPVFVDINPETLNIDVDLIEEKITDKTKAILPVYFAGNPPDMREVRDIADKHGLKVIADAAHAAGAEFEGAKIGSCLFEDMVCFSFHTQKNISCLGEGGMVSTNSKEFDRLLRLYSNHGIEYSDITSGCTKPSWYKECVDIGYNYRMSEGQAVVGVSQLVKLDRFNERRRELVMAYHSALKGILGLKTPVETPGAKSSWHLYVVQVGEEFGISRDDLFFKLKERGVGSNVHYTPVYLYKAYKDRGYTEGLCPKAEEAYKRVLSLPLSPAMSVEDVRYVAETLKQIWFECNHPN